MKKAILIALLSFGALFTKAQNTVTLESGTSPLNTYQLRYKAVTPDSLNHLWIYNGITLKYNRVFTATEANQRFAPAGSGVISVVGTTNRLTASPTAGNVVIDISATFEALLEKVANKASTYATVNNTLYPTIQLMRDSTLHPNKNLYDIANKTTARANLGLAIGTDVLAYRTFGTAANNSTSDFEVPLTFTYGLNRTTNTIKADSAVLKSKASALADYNVLMAGKINKADSASVANNYVTYGKYTYGATTQYNKTFVAPTLGVASATSLNITGTGGAGYVNFLTNGSALIPTPTGSVNIFSSSTNNFSIKNNAGFTTNFQTGNITATRTLNIPDVSAYLMTNPLTITGDIPYLSASSSTGTNVARLGIGSTGDVLKVVSGIPAWAAQSTLTSGNSTLWNSETITTSAKAAGDIMQYDGSKWVNAAVSVTAPLVKSGAGVGGTWSITQADATHDGYLPSANFNIFNAKQDALVNTTNIKSVNGTTLLGSGNLAITPSNTDTTSTGFATQSGVANTPRVVATYQLAGKTNVGAIFSYTPPSDGLYQLNLNIWTNSIATNTYRYKFTYSVPSGTAITATGSTITTASTNISIGSSIQTPALFLKGGVAFVLTTENVASGGSQNYDIGAALTYIPN